MIRVYIVDDSSVVRERLTEMLAETPGVQIIGQSGNPYEALDDILTKRPDAVILDIRLPGISGIDLLRRIKQERPIIQVMMLTNYAYPKYRQQSLAAGADYFFEKTTEFEKIPDTLSHLAAGVPP